MRVLFTGGSSFTGYWFIRELRAKGCDVVATFRQKPGEYGDPGRRQRVELAAALCHPEYGVAFGDERFLSLVRGGGWDLLCHHAADVTNYRSDDFDTALAVRNNTLNVANMVKDLAKSGCRGIVLTGSVFEGGEGAGSEGLPHFSPYGLSKSLTCEVFRFYCQRVGLALGKFVIPNPFGAHEEPRYTAYLMKNWFAGATPSCNSPLYVRDNIHVSLLAKVYAAFASGLKGQDFQRINPSGYVESQGAFTARVAEAMRTRLSLPCAYQLGVQTQFSEPRVRINTDVPDGAALGWSESEAWDEMAEFYRRRLAP